MPSEFPNKKLHTLYISLPEVWEAKLYTIYKRCSEKYANEYLDDRSWRAHITIGSRWLTEAETSVFAEVCQAATREVKPFHVHFHKFGRSEDGQYIFLELDPASVKQILEIRDRFLRFENELIGPVEKPEKYQLKINEFSHAEKERLQKTGSPYEFRAHISIVKLPASQTEELLIELEDHELLGEGFTVKNFNISRQSNDPENRFPVIERLEIE